jgi:translation elongation factor EF-Ts
LEEIKSKMPDRVSVADKIIEGRLKKFYAQIVLCEQPWILDNKKSVDNVVGAGVISNFKRLKIGE